MNRISRINLSVTRRRLLAAVAGTCTASLLLSGALGASVSQAAPAHHAAAGVLNGANADFDGDRASDFVMLGYDGGAPYNIYWDTAYSGGGYSDSAWGEAGSDRTLVGDYDGDGRTDQAVVRIGSTGQLSWYFRFANGTSKSVKWGANSLADIPVVGDFDGDGIDDPAVVRPNYPQAGLYSWVILGSKAGRIQIQWGANNLGDIPVTGDFDGDGKTDPAVLRTASNGQYTWVIHDSAGGTEHVAWGTKALFDHPVMGDFDGDGRTDFAVVRPDSPTKGLYSWAIKYATGKTAHIQWGANRLKDVPVAGDFDGDGKTDLAIVRPDGDSYEWAIRDSSGPHTHVVFGNDGYFTPLTREFPFSDLYFPKSNPIH